MIDLIKPCLENQLTDRQSVKRLEERHNQLSKRLVNMEVCFNENKGKNVAFDQINDRITEAEIW